MLRKLLGEMAWPVFLVHLAVFIAPGAVTALLIQGDGLGYLQQTLIPLLPFYALGFLLAWACQGRHGERWRAWVEGIIRYVPVLGKGRRQLALARLSAALESLICAGVTIIEAWELAAAASGSPALRRAVHAWKPQLQAGKTPAELVKQCPLFPSMFASLYFTAETSGDLDQTLRRLHLLYQDSGARKLHALAQWLPRAVYLIIAIVIGMQIVNFWTSYYNNLLNAF